MKLSIHDIEKSYDRKIIKNLSYEFQSGKLYVIKGVSGCGKSTLLNIIGGVEKEFNGSVQIDDKICNAQQMLSSTGYVFQYSLLLSGITIRENLELIHGDIEKIERLCELFYVKDLMQKYPDQISGGERQRISIVRALLQNPKIVLLDEPTASLDETNSKVAADAVTGLKSTDRIVIVATHEAYFDELADEILYLDYGEIAEVHKNIEIQAETGNEIDCILQKEGKKKGSINSLRYNLKRNKQLFRFFSLLPYVVMFLLLAFASTVQNNFESEYMKMIQKNYPVDVFNIYGFELDEFIYKDEVILYDRYIIVDDGSTAHYLAPEEESVLAIEGMIEFGAFPQSNNEIIISRELALDLNGENNDLKQLLGNTLAFADKEFVITGILYSFDEMERDELANGRFISYFLSDYYYHNIVGRLLFIPYETIKTMGEPVDTDIKRGVYKGLYNDKTAVESLRNALVSGKINIFDGEIASAKSELKGIIRILLMVVGVCFVIACVFMSSQIQTELFYRRKELGYLQIFGLKKKRVRELVCSGYFWKMIATLCMAGVIYAIVCGACSIILQSVLFFDMVHMAVMISGMVMFVLFWVCLYFGLGFYEEGYCAIDNGIKRFILFFSL